MAVNKLNKTKATNVIQETDHNELVEALSGALVPRNRQGSPANAGADLGTKALRWKDLYVQNINISGALTGNVNNAGNLEIINTPVGVFNFAGFGGEADIAKLIEETNAIQRFKYSIESALIAPQSFLNIKIGINPSYADGDISSYNSTPTYIALQDVNSITYNDQTSEYSWDQDKVIIGQNQFGVQGARGGRSFSGINRGNTETLSQALLSHLIKESPSNNIFTTPMPFIEGRLALVLKVGDKILSVQYGKDISIFFKSIQNFNTAGVLNEQIGDNADATTLFRRIVALGLSDAINTESLKTLISSFDGQDFNFFIDKLSGNLEFFLTIIPKGDRFCNYFLKLPRNLFTCQIQYRQSQNVFRALSGSQVDSVQGSDLVFTRSFYPKTIGAEQTVRSIAGIGAKIIDRDNIPPNLIDNPEFFVNGVKLLLDHILFYDDGAFVEASAWNLEEDQRVALGLINALRIYNASFDSGIIRTNPRERIRSEIINYLNSIVNSNVKMNIDFYVNSNLVGLEGELNPTVPPDDSSDAVPTTFDPNYALESKSITVTARGDNLYVQDAETIMAVAENFGLPRSPVLIRDIDFDSAHGVFINWLANPKVGINNLNQLIRNVKVRAENISGTEILAEQDLTILQNHEDSFSFNSAHSITEVLFFNQALNTFILDRKANHGTENYKIIISFDINHSALQDQGIIRDEDVMSYTTRVNTVADEEDHDYHLGREGSASPSTLVAGFELEEFDVNVNGSLTSFSFRIDFSRVDLRTIIKNRIDVNANVIKSVRIYNSGFDTGKIATEGTDFGTNLLESSWLSSEFVTSGRITQEKYNEILNYLKTRVGSNTSWNVVFEINPNTTLASLDRSRPDPTIDPQMPVDPPDPPTTTVPTDQKTQVLDLNLRRFQDRNGQDSFYYWDTNPVVGNILIGGVVTNHLGKAYNKNFYINFFSFEETQNNGEYELFLFITDEQGRRIFDQSELDDLNFVADIVIYDTRGNTVTQNNVSLRATAGDTLLSRVLSTALNERLEDASGDGLFNLAESVISCDITIRFLGQGIS